MSTPSYSETVKMCKSKRKFDELLLDAVDEALENVLGKTASKVCYNFLETKYSLIKENIPREIETFTACLENLLGSGALLIEEFILMVLRANLRLEYKGKEHFGFLNCLKELMTEYETLSSRT